MPEAEAQVTVTMNPLELKLFRRALAKAADDGTLERTPTLYRICELDALRWKAEDELAAQQLAPQGKPKPVKRATILPAVKESLHV
jgi:hypothetical protein